MSYEGDGPVVNVSQTSYNILIWDAQGFVYFISKEDACRIT